MCEKDGNITCIALYDYWFCSKTCYDRWLREDMDIALPFNIQQFFYLVEQQKDVLDMARQFEETSG